MYIKINDEIIAKNVIAGISAIRYRNWGDNNGYYFVIFFKGNNNEMNISNHPSITDKQEALDDITNIRNNVLKTLKADKIIDCY